MRVVSAINVRSIIMDHTPINKSTLDMVDYLRGGGFLPPIKVRQAGNGRFIICDGRHRVTAFKMLGRERIMAKHWSKDS